MLLEKKLSIQERTAGVEKIGFKGKEIYLSTLALFMCSTNEGNTLGVNVLPLLIPIYRSYVLSAEKAGFCRK